MKEIARRLSKGSLYVFISIVVIKVLNLTNSLVIARLLGPKDFGLYSILFSLQSVVILLAGFGVPPVITKYIAEYRVVQPKGIGQVLSTSFLGVLFFTLATSLTFFLASSFLAREIYKEGVLIPLIRLASFAILLMTLTYLSTAVLQGLQKIELLSKINILDALIKLGLTFLIVYHLGLLGVPLSWIAASGAFLVILGTIVFRLLSREKIDFQLRIDKKLFKEIFSLAFPLLLSGLVVASALWFGKTHLALAVGFQDVGFYQAAESLNRVVLFIPLAVSVPFLPVVSELEAKKTDELSKTASQVLKFSTLLTLPASLSIGLLGRFALILFGDRYEGAWEITYILSMAMFLMSMGTIIGTLLTGTGKMWQGLWLNCVWMVLFVCLSYVLIYTYGLNGLGYGYVLSYCLYTVILLMYATKRLGIKLKGLKPLFLLAILFFSVGNLIVRTCDGANLIVLSGAMLLVLLSVEYLLLSPEEKKLILRLWGRRAY